MKRRNNTMRYLTATFLIVLLALSTGACTVAVNDRALVVGPTPVIVAADPAYPQATATAEVNLRSGPGMEFGVIAVLHRGEVVDVLEYRVSWVRVWVSRLNREAWVSRSYIRPIVMRRMY